MLDGSSPKNKCAIYLQHTNGVHYVVLDMCSTMHGGTPKKESRSQRKRKHVSVVEDCSTLYDPVTKIPRLSICKQSAFETSGNNTIDCVINNSSHNLTNSFDFTPIDKTTQEHLCTLVNLPLIIHHMVMTS